MPTDSRPVIIPDFAAWKSRRRRITVLTAYDFPTARLLDGAGVDCLLVGDSLGTVIQGWETTLRVTLDQVVYHAEMVARAARRALVVADLPFLSYQVSPRQALRSAGRLLKETNCQAVKLEGGCKMTATITALVDAGIPVMGHVGLQPQTIRRLGGHKVQRSTDEILADAQAVAAAGAFAVVLECIPIDPRREDHGAASHPHDRHRRRTALRRSSPGRPRHARPDRAVPSQVRPPLRRTRPANPRRRRGLRCRRCRGTFSWRG